MPFQFQRLHIPDVVLIHAKQIPDGRGFFRELFKQSEFAANGIQASFVQTNHSRSTRGVLRGLHYQIQPRAQGKLISVMRGEIFDVAVDVRRGSPTYGQWVGQMLSVENSLMLYVPPGFAHGFCVTSDEADLMYQVTAEYARDLERGIAWNDPAVGVVWPIEAPSLSERDLRLPMLKDADNNFVFAA